MAVKVSIHREREGEHFQLNIGYGTEGVIHLVSMWPSETNRICKELVFLLLLARVGRREMIVVDEHVV